jgi:hypothetical protein
MARRGYPDAAGYSMQGFLGGYWQTTARIDRFDKYLYYKQIATMTQLTGELMVADIIKVSPYWGNLETAIAALPDSAFIAPGSASDQRNALLRDSDSVFNLVKAGAYGKATKKLQNLENEITLSIVAASQAPLITLIDKAIALLAS